MDKTLRFYSTAKPALFQKKRTVAAGSSLQNQWCASPYSLFEDMYQYIKERGYAIYPGKVTEADTFRIGNIGEIYEEDILKVVSLFKEFLETRQEV